MARKFRIAWVDDQLYDQIEELKREFAEHVDIDAIEDFGAGLRYINAYSPQPEALVFVLDCYLPVYEYTSDHDYNLLKGSALYRWLEKHGYIHTAARSDLVICDDDKFMQAGFWLFRMAIALSARFRENCPISCVLYTGKQVLRDSFYPFFQDSVKNADGDVPLTIAYKNADTALYQILRAQVESALRVHRRNIIPSLQLLHPVLDQITDPDSLIAVLDVPLECDDSGVPMAAGWTLRTLFPGYSHGVVKESEPSRRGRFLNAIRNEIDQYAMHAVLASVTSSTSDHYFHKVIHSPDDHYEEWIESWRLWVRSAAEVFEQKLKPVLHERTSTDIGHYLSSLSSADEACALAIWRNNHARVGNLIRPCVCVLQEAIRESFGQQCCDFSASIGGEYTRVFVDFNTFLDVVQVIRSHIPLHSEYFVRTWIDQQRFVLLVHDHGPGFDAPVQQVFLVPGNFASQLLRLRGYAQINVRSSSMAYKKVFRSNVFGGSHYDEPWTGHNEATYTQFEITLNTRR